MSAWHVSLKKIIFLTQHDMTVGVISYKLLFDIKPIIIMYRSESYGLEVAPTILPTFRVQFQKLNVYVLMWRKMFPACKKSAPSLKNLPFFAFWAFQ